MGKSNKKPHNGKSLQHKSSERNYINKSVMFYLKTQYEQRNIFIYLKSFTQDFLIL